MAFVRTRTMFWVDTSDEEFLVPFMTSSTLAVLPSWQDPIPVRLSGRRHGAAQDDRVVLACVHCDLSTIHSRDEHV